MNTRSRTKKSQVNNTNNNLDDNYGDDENLDLNDQDYQITSEDSDDEFNDIKKKKIKTKYNQTNNIKKSKTKRKISKMTNINANPEYVADIKQTFDRFDTENKGCFEINQLKFAMRALGFEPKKEEIKRISDELDKNGFIYYDDFVELMLKRIMEKNANDEILKAFQLFDTNQKGKITFEDLKRVANDLGEKITDEELMEMIEEADLDGDNAVDSEEFLRIMKKTYLY